MGSRMIFNLFLLVIVSISSIGCSSVRNNVDSEAEKRISQMQDSIANIHANEAMRARKFVIMADRVFFGPSGRVFSNPRGETNFIYMVGDEGVVQFAFENGHLGLNGLGGITLKGRVSTPVIKEDKKGNTLMRYTIYDTGVSATIDVTLYKGSNYANAYVSGNFSSGSLNIYGKMIPYEGNK